MYMTVTRVLALGLCSSDILDWRTGQHPVQGPWTNGAVVETEGSTADDPLAFELTKLVGE